MCVCVESLPRMIEVSEEYSTRETEAFCRRSAFSRCSNTIRLRIRFLREKAYLSDRTYLVSTVHSTTGETEVRISQLADFL